MPDEKRRRKLFMSGIAVYTFTLVHMGLFINSCALQEDMTLFSTLQLQKQRNFSDDVMNGEPVDFDYATPHLRAKSLLPLLLKVDCSNKVRGGIYCHEQCSHFKLMERSSGCCRCNCKLGYVLQPDRTTCNKAFWSSWSTWSKCIDSDWGGLQLRERICVSGGVVTNGRCVGRGSEERKCSGTKRGYRLRKNVRSLTDMEMHDLIQAFSKLKEDSSKRGFYAVTKWHGWPFLCPWYKRYNLHENGHCSWHEHPLFLSWHRMIMVQMELSLNRYLINKNLGIPYWDWMETTSTGLPPLVRDPFIFDPILDRYVKNPFFTTYLPDHSPYKNHTLHVFRYVKEKAITNHSLLLRSVIRALNMPNYATMDTILEDSHNQIHNGICPGCTTSTQGDCLYSMLSTTYSAFDPVFYLHHSQVDRLFALYKKAHDVMEDQDWTKESFTGPYKTQMGRLTSDYSNSFDWPMSPFCNTTINFNPVTSKYDVWTPHNAYYYKNLFGYKYDSYDLGGHSWQGILLDLKRRSRHGNGLVFPFVSNLDVTLGIISRSSSTFGLICR